MAYSLGRQRTMVLIGFLTVAVGWIGYIAVAWGERSPWAQLETTNIIFGAGSILGYAVLAVASWSWFRWIENCPFQLAGLVRVLRLFAVGTLFIAGGLASVGYFWANQAVTQPFDGRTAIAAAMSYGLEFFGFLLAAAAFWAASAQVNKPRPDRSATDGDLVTV